MVKHRKKNSMSKKKNGGSTIRQTLCNIFLATHGTCVATKHA